jgi:DNA-binding beta-propeller fold protein YncE
MRRGGIHVPMKGWRPAAMALATVAVCAVPAVSSATSASATWQAPGYERTIGGTGTAGVYAWGIAYDAATNQLEVADYWNFFVRSYSLTGQQTNSFYQSASTRQGQPESIAVDPRNGNIWVAENGTQKTAGYVAEFSDTGTYLGEVDTRSEYTAWIAMDGSGDLFVVNGHLSGSSGNPNRVQVYNTNESGDPETCSWGTYGSGPGDFIQAMGIAVSASGDVYVADASNLRVSEFDPNLSTCASTHNYNGGWVQDFGVGHFTGDLRGVAIDPVNDLLYVVDAHAGRVEEFNLNGTWISQFGSLGTGPGQFQDGGRQVTVDGQGNVWVADYSDYRFEEFTSAGTFEAAYPQPAEPPAPGFLSEARGVAVNPSDGSVWVADAWNDRFQQFAPDGAFEATYGHRGSVPPYGLDYPRGIGVDPGTGNVWVLDTRDSVIRVYAEDGIYLYSLGSGLDSSAPGSFEAPVDVSFRTTDGVEYAYIADYWSCDVTIWNASDDPPVYAGQISNVCNNYGVAVDPATADIYVTQQGGGFGGGPVLVFSPFNPSSPTSFSEIGHLGSFGSGTGQLESPWGVDVVNGDVYVADVKLGDVQVFQTNGTYLGHIGAKGNAAGQFNQPSELANDSAGDIYVADANVGRVQEFSYSVVPPATGSDTTPPTVTLTSPTAKQVMPASEVVITGSATDNVGLGDLEVAIHNATTNLWWNGSLSNWSTKKTWNIAAPVCTTMTACTFSFGLVGETYGGTYTATARAVDTSGNSASTPLVKFTVARS